jgi:hypothetical protein
MSITIIQALVEKQAIAVDTIITASYFTKDLFGRTYEKTGDFKLKRIIYTESQHLFELRSIDNEKIGVRTDASSIQAIDGMDITRYADIYDILPDGSRKKVGRKRGRKSKSQLSQ